MIRWEEFRRSSTSRTRRQGDKETRRKGREKRKERKKGRGKTPKNRQQTGSTRIMRFPFQDDVLRVDDETALTPQESLGVTEILSRPGVTRDTPPSLHTA
jgi:hypothetical protein